MRAVPGLRALREAAPRSAIPDAGIVDPDPAAAATRLLAALAADGDPLAELCRAASDIAGVPAVVLYRREGTRHLLAHRHGDGALADEAAGGSATDADGLDGAGAIGLPLELKLPPGDGPYPIVMHGRGFAALPMSAGLMAIGPVRGKLRRRERARLGRLAAVLDGALLQATAAAARRAEVAALRSEVDMARRSLGSTIDESRSFGLLLDLAITSSGARGGLVAVRRGERLVVLAHRDLPEGAERLDLTPGSGVLGEVPGIPGLLIVEGPDALERVGIDGLLAVVGPRGGAAVELVFALVPQAAQPLPDDCTGLLETIVDQAMLVLESSRAARTTAGRHFAALRGLCRALDARSPETARHHDLVAGAADAIARRLGVPDEERRTIVAAASVHDVGMLAADSTLAAEFAHPTLGADMASLVPGAADLAPLLRAHHEWWDGFGFPAGLAGEAIPRGARILGAAEFYVESLQLVDGMPSAERMSDEIHARRGVQLDPACADAMLWLLWRGARRAGPREPVRS